MIKYFPGNIEDFKEYAITSLSLININTLKMNKLENYDALLRDALLEQKNIEETFNIFEKKVLETKGDYVDIYLLDKLSCLILDCNTTHIYLNLSSLADMSQRCEIHKYIMENFLTARNLTYNNRLRDGVMYNNSINNNSINNYSLNNISFEEKIFMYYLLENLSKSLNSSNMNYGETIIDYEIIVKDKINKYKNILLTELNISEVNISEVENETGHYIVINNFIFDNNRSSNQTKYMYYFLDFEPLVKTMINISFYCNRKEEKISLDEYIVKEQQLPGFNETPDIVSINKPLQKCCLYGNCEECGINKKYPIIMLHGHSFNQKNSAYQNTEIFNFLENEMESKNYISFGIWDPLKVYIFDKNSTIMFNSIFKPTYYVSYNNVLLGNNFLESKNESIEIYANRLKNIIEDIKEKTGSKKVDIIAHSMGGLVVRRYIQEYGPEDINKFIMIGTPNKGINDRVHGICKIFGNDLECDEMHQDSEFIRKLNQNYSMPETYLIIGRGCEMQNEDSDGVVLVKNAQLDYQVKKTYYIDGNCTTTSLLHNNMLKMHEVTSIIYRIIK
ncbi:MAG: hypothetical protein KatS3mg002_0702 [Candidatus Woesearchaeota archaeon]|nr:MAG: hypothetical protein KatS3mg002_0702 [Candidatus Woesearchaeota archaeon]